MLLAVELEDELVAAVLGDVGDITLQLRVSPTPLSVLPMTLSRTQTYQVDDTGRVGLVLSAFGKEEKTLASLAGPSSVGVSKAKLFILEVGDELLALDGLFAEPEVSLDKAETPVIQSFVSLVFFFPYTPLPSLPKACICYLPCTTYLTSPGALYPSWPSVAGVISLGAGSSLAGSSAAGASSAALTGSSGVAVAAATGSVTAGVSVAAVVVVSGTTAGVSSAGFWTSDMAASCSRELVGRVYILGIGV